MNAIVIHKKARRWIIAKDMSREDPIAILAVGHRRLGLSSSHMPPNAASADIAKMESLLAELTYALAKHKHSWIIGMDAKHQPA